MKNKTILIVSVFLTIFILTIGGGLISSVVAKNAATPAPTADVSAFMEREKAYQALISEANQKIELANQQITALLGSTQTPVGYLFTPEQAASIAANLAGTQPIKPPELVNFNNTPAYEVEFERGKIYIDVNTGEVLYNGLRSPAPSYITTDQAVQIAQNYLGITGVVNVYFGEYNGSQAYIVQFSNGQSVYVTLYGKVIAVQMPSSSSSSSHNSDDDDESEHDD